jgi:hypothetical protein
MPQQKRPPNAVIVAVTAAAVVGLAVCAIAVRGAGSIRFPALVAPFKTFTQAPPPTPFPRPQRGP